MPTKKKALMPRIRRISSSRKIEFRLISLLLQLRLLWPEAVFDHTRRISSWLQINQLGFPRLIEFFSKIFNCSVKADRQRHLKKRKEKLHIAYFAFHKGIETPVVMSVMEC